MEVRRTDSPSYVSDLWVSRGGSLFHHRQQEVQSILLKRRVGWSLTGGCLPHFMDEGSSLCISSNTFDPQNGKQDQARQRQTILVVPTWPRQILYPYLICFAVCQWLFHPFSTWLLRTLVRLFIPAWEFFISNLGCSMISGIETSSSAEVQQMLLNSKKLSTQSTYLQKWKTFQHWCVQQQFLPVNSSLFAILDYLLELKKSGLSMSSIRVHLAVIIAFHSFVEGFTVFVHP